MTGMSRVHAILFSSSSWKYPLYAARLAIRNSTAVASNRTAPARLVIRTQCNPLALCHAALAQHRLYLIPEPQGQGALREGAGASAGLLRFSLASMASVMRMAS